MKQAGARAQRVPAWPESQPEGAAASSARTTASETTAAGAAARPQGAGVLEQLAGLRLEPSRPAESKGVSALTRNHFHIHGNDVHNAHYRVILP